MTHMEIKARENAGRKLAVWTEGFDGKTHYADICRALVPAVAILIAAVILMLAVL